MRISSARQSSQVQRKSAKRSGGAGGAAFSVSEQAESAGTLGAQAMASIGSMDALLALQAVDDPLNAKRRAVDYGNDVLDVLDKLKTDLLAGQVSIERMNRLVGLLAQKRGQVPDEIGGLLDEIELRAQVELAKLGGS